MTEGIAINLMMVFLLLSAFLALHFRSLINSIVAMSVFSINMTVLFAFYQAPDVAMAEAVVGAGLVTALYVLAIARTSPDEGGDKR